jgi:RNA polymerase sigma factor (sigma-70 family)
MAMAPLSRVIGLLRSAALLKEGADLPDVGLLEAFLARRDEAAFEALVRRHGPMVLGVCRRVLRDRHDAEDAFQATFLVLIRKAAAIGRRELLANWLYGVAQRTALHARKLAAKRKLKEREVADMPPKQVTVDQAIEDMLPVLDQELSRLPDKYRVPIILCDLEGRTGKEAAKQLGLPEKTLATRLGRGRALLAKRLSRHGAALSGSAVAMTASWSLASASVPVALVKSTVNAGSLMAAGKMTAAAATSIKVAARAEGVV